MSSLIKIGKGRFITEEEHNRLILPSGSMIPPCGSTFVTLGSDIIFNNPDLNRKIVDVGVWHSSNSSTMTYEIARRDGRLIDVERYMISTLSGGTASIVGPIKEFPEHHSESLPLCYK